MISIDRQMFPGMETLPRAPVTLLFRGAVNDVLPEGLYQVAVEDGPEFSFYINPIHTFERDRQDYQVVFN